ncbi:MAG: YdcF family protein [Archangium sp.]
MRRILLVPPLIIGLAAWRIDREGVVDDAAPSDAIVVLGARVQPDGSPSPTLKARAEHAAELFNNGLAPKLIFSGGVGDFGKSEASVARDVVVKLGVPSEACVLEEDSHSTKQNAQFTARLLPRNSSVIIVTDPSHLPRAKRLFINQQLTVTGSPVMNAPRHVELTERVYWTLREVAASLR